MKSLTQNIISKLKRGISDQAYRKGYLSDLRKKYRGICGYFSNYIPQEIIAAAGLHPCRIIGRYVSSQEHKRAGYNPLCSFVQDMYAAAKTNSMACFDTIVFPNSCDSIKYLSQMWQSDICSPPAYTLLHPVKADQTAIKFFASQIQGFVDWLVSNGGVAFSEEAFLQTINTYNQTREMLRKLYQLRSVDPQILPASDLLAIMTAALIMDRAEYNQILHDLLDELEDKKAANDKSQKRVMVIGPLLDNIELLSRIESLGAAIVADEVTNGWRYIGLNVETQGNLYSNLARRYLTSGPSPTMSLDPSMRSEQFTDHVLKHNIKGVLCINQKFCEPHIHNYLAKSDLLKKMNINSLLLEIEHGQYDISERDLLRLESFIEVC